MINKTSILPSGAFFPKTTKGFIINPCSIDLIDDRYIPVLEAIKAAYIIKEGVNLHSIYLRGSVARGMVTGNCDIDTFALVFSENEGWREPGWASEIQRNLTAQYPFLAAVEIYLAGYAPVWRSIPGTKKLASAKTNPNLAMIIKTQSLCLHGENISALIPNYRPDESMMLSHRWLEKDIAGFNKNKKSIPLRQQLLKTLLRSGFELVMPKIKQYTPDLYLCYISFAHFYPKKGKAMKRALSAYLNPMQTKKKEIKWIVAEVGEWLVGKGRLGK